MSAVYWLARSSFAVAGRAPRPFRHALASTVMSASYLGWRSKRRITQDNMAFVLGLSVSDRRVKRAALASWSNYGRTAAYLTSLPYLDMRDVAARTLDVTEGMTWTDSVRAAMAPGKGMIITTGHFGSWDLAGAIAARHVQLSAIVDTFQDPQLDRLLQGYRRDKGVDIIPVSGAPRRAMHELAQSRALAIVVDRPAGAEHSVEVTFFGHRTRVPSGSAALAVKTGAAIMPGYVWYAPGNHYFLRAFPPVFPRAVTNGTDRMKEVQRLMQYIFSCQEEVVRQCPTQWFMFRRFWPAMPLSVGDLIDDGGEQAGQALRGGHDARAE
jgi:lauroyl/myristoyl acyltransferase